MGDNTGIEWCDATWNPVLGCEKVSPGCDHCYAIPMSSRVSATGNQDYAGVVGYDVNGRVDWSGTIKELPARLDQPARWAKPRRVFVNSMSDLFHAGVSEDFIAAVWAVMAITPQHTYQVLTKRHGRMRALLNSTRFQAKVSSAITTWAVYPTVFPAALHKAAGASNWYGNTWPLPNVWLGVSVENQRWADVRIPALADTPAAVRFLSMEPLLGPVDLTPWLPRTYETGLVNSVLHYASQGGRCDFQQGDFEGHSRHVVALCRQCTNGRRISWVIAGGESGPGARPMSPDWVRSLRDQCVIAAVPFHFKQWGSGSRCIDKQGDIWELGADGLMYTPETAPFPREHVEKKWGPLRPLSKKLAGRELDGRTWTEFPAYDAADGSIVKVNV